MCEFPCAVYSLTRDPRPFVLRAQRNWEARVRTDRSTSQVLQAQVYPTGEVSVYDARNVIDYLKVHAGSKFDVEWAAAPAGEAQGFPTIDRNCTSGCIPYEQEGGSCLCAVTVEDTAFVTGASSSFSAVPTEVELRASLMLGAPDPALYGYKLCTTVFCTSRTGVRVHTKGPSASPMVLGHDAIFEFTNTVYESTPSKRRPAKYLFNRISTVHVGRSTEYRMLEVSAGVKSSCTSSTYLRSNHVCEKALDQHVWSEWVTKREQAGAWIEVTFDGGAETIDRMQYANRCQEHEMNKVLELSFDDGTTQKVTIPKANGCDSHTYSLKPVRTSAVKATVLEAHPGGQEWSNNGMRELKFYEQGKAAFASTTPCEDAGLVPLDQHECEVAGPLVLPSGETIGNFGRVSIGGYGHTPPQCSIKSGLAGGKWELHWTLRDKVQRWQLPYWPICKAPANSSRTSGFQFRNPPHFVSNIGEQRWIEGGHGDKNGPYNDGDHLLASAEHETEALIDHLFNHENTAPFVAYRMIQRLVTSNPSPRYNKLVATAFIEGKYGDTTYSGKHGDMAALVTAILLDREARSPIIEADPTKGRLREPLLKVIHLLRSLEYKPRWGQDVNLADMQEKVGQMAFDSPSVFNFYLPEFAPAGPVSYAGLVAPEAQLGTAPQIIGYLNGVASLVDYGLSHCEHGFGDSRPAAYRECTQPRESTEARSDGVLTYAPTEPTNPASVITELSLLLTGGQLSEQTRQVLTAAYEKHVSETPFDMAKGKAEAMAATHISPEECLQAVQLELGIPAAVNATCTSSDDQNGRFPCENLLDNDHKALETEWRARTKVATPWLDLQFVDGAIQIDRMAYIQRHHVKDMIRNVRLEFSDGSSQTVELQNNRDHNVYQLKPVKTTFVKITAQSYYGTSTTPGARGIHFFPAGKWSAEQGRIYLIKGTWPKHKNIPAGCSYQNPGDYAAHYNEDPEGCGYPNCYNYKSVFSQANLFMVQQSSNKHEMSPWNAIDGVKGVEGRTFSKDSCIHTNEEENPWWQVDLGTEQEITAVVVHNRNCGAACAEQNRGFNVYVDGVACAVGVDIEQSEVLRVPCARAGTMVRIVNPGTERVLSFCEVEVLIKQDAGADGSYPARPDAAVVESAAVRDVIKLFGLSPEFHATNKHVAMPVMRELPAPMASFQRQYKAVVVLFLEGGADSYNMVVPHSGCKKPDNADDLAHLKDDDYLYQEYRSERGADMALRTNELIAFSAKAGDGQPCETFGFHPSLKHFADMYNAGDATVFANMGGLIEPVTLNDYNNKHKPGAKQFPLGNFGHNLMQKHAWTVHAGYGDAQGVLGRMVNKLVGRKAKPYNSALHSMEGYQRMLQGSVTPTIIQAGEGVVRFSQYDKFAAEIANMTDQESASIFAETYSALLQRSLQATEVLGRKLGNTTLDSGRTFETETTNRLAQQFLEVSKVMQLELAEGKVERSAFYARAGGWDSHGNYDISEQLNQLDDALVNFTAELKEQKLWDDTVIVVVSDFGRTLTSNSQGA